METIVCPTDFSKCADNALEYANELALHLHTRLILFHSIYSLDIPDLINYDGLGGVAYIPPVKDTAYEELQKEKLEALRKTLISHHPGVPTQYETRIKYGLIKDTIKELVNEDRADLVVLGTEGADAINELLAGSIAGVVLERTSCPVMIIPEPARYKPIRRIVFATDLEGEPYVDVNFVLKLAGIFDAEILFLHILPEETERAREGAQTEMNKLYKTLPYENVKFFINPHPNIEEGINQFTRQQNADMLVMGHHPRGFWQHLFTKDHAREMAYHTRLPLLVLHYKN